MVKWAYHATSLSMSHNIYSKKEGSWLADDNTTSTERGFFHLANLVESGLVPRTSKRQTLSYRKSRLKERLNEKFVYFYYPQPDLFQLAIHYGDGLVIDEGGMLFRFKPPKIHWQDPDVSDPNIRMTKTPIKTLQVLIPPKKYFEILGGKGGDSRYSSIDYAAKYLEMYCINNDKFWETLTLSSNPWINQKEDRL